MTSKGSKSLNNVFRIVRQLLIGAIVENTWHKCVEWFYKRQEVAAAWEVQDLVFSQKVTELINYCGDKGRTYDIILLDWGINNYNVYNRNGLIETVIFYTYIIFI
jgi:predicted sugar kinase